MPTLHRLACFRDDVVFLVFLYQRWIYRVDPKRVNEVRVIAIYDSLKRSNCACSTAKSWSRTSLKVKRGRRACRRRKTSKRPGPFSVFSSQCSTWICWLRRGRNYVVTNRTTHLIGPSLITRRRSLSFSLEPVKFNTQQGVYGCNNIRGACML